MNYRKWKKKGADETNSSMFMEMTKQLDKIWDNLEAV